MLDTPAIEPINWDRPLARQAKFYSRGFLQSGITISHRSLSFRQLRFASSFASSEARLDPLLNVIESVFHSVGVLTGRSFASSIDQLRVLRLSFDLSHRVDSFTSVG